MSAITKEEVIKWLEKAALPKSNTSRPALNNLVWLEEINSTVASDGFRAHLVWGENLETESNDYKKPNYSAIWNSVLDADCRIVTFNVKFFLDALSIFAEEMIQDEDDNWIYPNSNPPVAYMVVPKERSGVPIVFTNHDQNLIAAIMPMSESDIKLLSLSETRKKPFDVESSLVTFSDGSEIAMQITRTLIDGETTEVLEMEADEELLLRPDDIDKLIKNLQEYKRALVENRDE